MDITRVAEGRACLPVDGGFCSGLRLRDRSQSVSAEANVRGQVHFALYGANINERSELRETVHTNYNTTPTAITRGSAPFTAKAYSV